MERFSRDSAHLKHSNSCPRSSNSKTLEFSSTFIKLWYVKNWNRMQNSAALGVFYRCEEYALLLHATCAFLSHMRDIGMKSVTYWYQFFTRSEELVPILHGVKFTKCEIYGSTALYGLISEQK